MRKEKAITLISLVITIIILIILAGVAVNLSLGENGIFKRAKEARDKYGAEAEKEQKQLNELYAGLNRGNEPENTPETEGTTSANLKSSYVLLTTGSTEKVKRMNIYDVSGNLAEWTNEAAYASEASYSSALYNTYIFRGGSFYYEYANTPACCRDYYYAPHSSTHRRFRVALYLE